MFLSHTGKLQKKKWENAMTIDKQSWGYRRNTRLSEFLTTDELVATLVETVRLITFTLWTTVFMTLRGQSIGELEVKVDL